MPPSIFCTMDQSNDETYDAFDQFGKGNSNQIIDWIRMGKVDADDRDCDHGDTLLQWAARHHAAPLAYFLIYRRECDLNHRSNVDGKTALDLYQLHKEDGIKQHIAQLLRERGAKTSKELGDEDW